MPATVYVERMEDELELYEKPYNPRELGVCFDERPVHLLDSKRRPRPMHPGKPARVDYEYVRCGSANVFCAVEPKAGWHFVKANMSRKAPDFAEALRDVTRHYSTARCIPLVLDNLNIHGPFSLTRRFGWREGMLLWKRFCVHYTPMHGSWLNQAEVEVSHVSRQCLGKRRVPNVEEFKAKTKAWERKANRRHLRIQWAFTVPKAHSIFRYQPADFIRSED